MKKNVRSILAFALALSMCLSVLPMGVLAEEDTGLCPHHLEHSGCSYVEGHDCKHVCGQECIQQVRNCTHTCTADCYIGGVEENGLIEGHHVCSVESGCITEVKNCKHPADHDDTCGYVKGQPCTFYCAICNHIAVDGVTLESAITVNVGDSATLNAVITPADATNKAVSWSSSDTSVATVADGVVTGLKAGTAEITVTTSEGSFSAVCTVTVENVPVESVSLNLEELTLIESFGTSLSATISPANATDKTVTWTSSDTAVATVADGVVTAVSAGEAVITVTTVDGAKSASCTVTVNPFIHVESVSLNPGELTLVETYSTKLTATVAPENATNKAVAWSTSNADVAAVDASGNVTAKGEGIAVITAASIDGGKTASCTVTVEPFIHVETVNLNKTVAALKLGDSLSLTATVAPENAHNKSITWSSSDPAVATVANGVVTPVTPGTAVITVTSADGGIKASCTVIVAEEIIDVTGVSLDKTELALPEGESETLTAIVAPDDATNKAVTWTSDKAEVASVDATGKVTAHSVGDAIITATTVDGEKTASCKVTVTRAVTQVKLNKTSLTLIEGGTETLTATVLPEDALDKEITWTSSDEKIATVDAAGKVTAVSKGKATITAATKNGKSAECVVTVTPVNCTVSFNSNGGTFVPDVIVKNGDKLTAPAQPTKAGYIFMGWYKDKELKNAWNFATDVVTDDMILYARWDVKYQFKLTYSSNTDKSVCHMPDDEVVETNLTEWTFQIPSGRPHRTGYWFAGWNTSPDGKGTAYRRGGEITATAGNPNLTLYAQWRRMDMTNYKTSDDSHIQFWTALLIFSGVSLAAVGAYVLIKRKKK